MRTEEEARKCWCPFARAQGIGQELSHNRPEHSYNCIASECMAWESLGKNWIDEVTVRETGDCGLKRKP